MLVLEKIKGENMKTTNVESLVAVHTHTHTHTHTSDSIEEKLYIKYKRIKVGM